MNELALAYAIGAVSGSRSLLGPALVTHRVLPAAERVLGMMALGEMIADKSPGMPARITPLPLAGRIVTGALAAAGAAPRGRRLPAAVAGAAGAASAAYALYHLRVWAARAGVPNVVAGLAEDAFAAGAGSLILRYR